MGKTDCIHPTPRGGDIRPGQVYWHQKPLNHNFTSSHMVVVISISNSKKSIMVVPLTSNCDSPNVFLGTIDLPAGDGRNSYAAVDNIMTIGIDPLRRCSRLSSSPRIFMDPMLGPEQYELLLDGILRRIVTMKLERKQLFFQKHADFYAQRILGINKPP